MRGDLGEVEALGLELHGALAEGELVAPLGRRRPRGAARASLSACPFVRRSSGVEGAELGLEAAQLALLAQQLRLERRQLVEARGRGEARHAGIGDAGDVVEHRGFSSAPVRPTNRFRSRASTSTSGHREAERAALADLGRRREAAAVGLDEAPADPEAEAGAGRLAVVAAEELAEHPGEVGRAGCPRRVSCTATATSPSPTVPSTRMPIGLPYFAAFSTRFVRTCSTLSGSA